MHVELVGLLVCSLLHPILNTDFKMRNGEYVMLNTFSITKLWYILPFNSIINLL